jgi:hypothetical protein
MPKTNLTPQGVAALSALEEAVAKSIFSIITPAIKQGAMTDHDAFIGVVSVLNAIAIDAGITAGFTKTNYIHGVASSWDRIKAEEEGEDNPDAQQVLEEVKMAQQAMDALMARLKGNGEGEGK